LLQKLLHQLIVLRRLRFAVLVALDSSPILYEQSLCLVVPAATLSRLFAGGDWIESRIPWWLAGNWLMIRLGSPPPRARVSIISLSDPQVVRSIFQKIAHTTSGHQELRERIFRQIALNLDLQHIILKVLSSHPKAQKKLLQELAKSADLKGRFTVIAENNKSSQVSRRSRRRDTEGDAPLNLRINAKALEKFLNQPLGKRRKKKPLSITRGR
jgi:hypothetical protein